MTAPHPLLHTAIASTSTDLIAPARVAALGAVLDRSTPPGQGDSLPELWHWIFFWDAMRQADVGSDGYRHVDSEAPGRPAPQHMWAGSRLRFHAPLAIGEQATLSARIANIETKPGRRGKLTFVTTHYTLTQSDRLMLQEERDIVHIEPADVRTQAHTQAHTQTNAQMHAQQAATPPLAAAKHSMWERTVYPTETLLFRYSALTFNGHRIHYDYPYATGVEGYPHLLVHGPLLATLLMDLLHRNRPGAVVREFTFKAMRPTFLGHPFRLCGEPTPGEHGVALWAEDHEGYLTMTAHAVLA